MSWEKKRRLGQWEHELTDPVEKHAGNGLGLGIAAWAELGLALMP